MQTCKSDVNVMQRAVGAVLYHYAQANDPRLHNTSFVHKEARLRVSIKSTSNCTCALVLFFILVDCRCLFMIFFCLIFGPQKGISRSET